MPRSLTWLVRGRVLTLDRPIVMGVLNVTPDSFSDGGCFTAPEAAVRRAGMMIAEGADVIDVGGQSTRPDGAVRVTAAVELRRVMPVVRAIVAEYPDSIISVDTVNSTVAGESIAAGAHIVNDVSAMRLDSSMGAVVAATGAGIVLMHSRGDVTSMATYEHAEYDGCVTEVVQAELGACIRAARASGIDAGCIALDPGLGFAKRPDDSLRMLARLDRLVALGHPVVVGASRKRMIGGITGVTDPAARVHGSVGAALAAWARGAAVLRVHDVAATRQALDVVAAIERASFDTAMAEG